MLPIIKSNQYSFPSLTRLFDDFFSAPVRASRVPSVNITDEGKHYDIALAAPGLKKEDFHINLENGILTVHTEQEEHHKEEKKEDENCPQCLIEEYNYSSFTRSFGLPEDVKEDAIEAKYEDGVLHVILPKRKEAITNPQRKIAVK